MAPALDSAALTGVGAPELEITPAMIDAAAEALSGPGVIADLNDGWLAPHQVAELMLRAALAVLDVNP